MIPARVRIFVCTAPVDMRRRFDVRWLALAVRERLNQDPRAGGLFVFANRRADRRKILFRHGPQGIESVALSRSVGTTKDVRTPRFQRAEAAAVLQNT